jgi:hypothetical protein
MAEAGVGVELWRSRSVGIKITAMKQMKRWAVQYRPPDLEAWESSNVTRRLKAAVGASNSRQPPS